jgi:phosphate starvation-inducible protein PhoH and related proteins
VNHTPSLSHLVKQATIPTSGIDRLTLFGRNDAHLALLELRFGVSVVARGEGLVIDGPAQSVDDAAGLVSSVVQRLRTSRMDPEEIEATIQQRTPLPHSDGSPVVSTYRSPVRPRTAGQADYLRAMQSTDMVFSIGPAGTGKTYLAVAVAVAALRAKQVARILLARPAVEAGESLGFLPGSFEDKVDPYLRPLYDALQDLLEPERLRRMQDMKIVEVVPLAYMRGRTLNDAFIILDEAQNTTPQQMMMFLTRLGRHSHAVVTGDITQTDLPKGQPSGLVEVQDVLRHVEGLAFVHLTERDVVRNPLVQEIVKAYDAYRERQLAVEPTVDGST